MKYIKQISTGFAVFREEPHSDKTLSNAAIFTGIDIADLVVMDESVSDDEWNKKSYDAIPWKEKMAESDSSMTRMWEDFLTLNGTDGWPQITKDRHISKVALRATKPEAS